MNTGTSINFDANALQTQDEAEFQKEEQQQLEELRELLSNALDNLTEDGLSVSSNDEDDEGEISRDGSFKNGKKQRLSGNSSFDHPPVLSSTFPGGAVNKLIPNGHLQAGKALGSTLPGNPPSNDEEVTQPYNHPQQDFQPQQQPMYYPQYHYLYPAEENGTPDGHTVNNYDGHSHAIYPGITGSAHPGHHYGIVQGGVLHGSRAENDQWMTPGNGQENYQENFRQNHLPSAGGEGSSGGGAGYYNHIQNSMPYDAAQSFVPGHRQPYQTNGTDLNTHPHPHRSSPEEDPSIPTSVGREIPHPQTNGYTLPVESEHAITSNWDQLNGYKVQYRKATEPVLSPQKKEHPHNNSASQESSPQKPEKDFIRIGGSTDQKGLAQLQILYKARGRKIEELNQELASIKTENAREIRLLQHKVSSAEGECEEVKNNQKQCQEMLHEAKSENTQLLTRMETAEALIQALSNSKEDLVGKLVAAEAAVESLNHQLKELGKSETLERARQQHDSVVESLQLRHQKEVVLLKEEIDDLIKATNSSNEEISLLKRQLTDSLKNVDNAHISKAETINRLTRSLEESQRQNQYLLQNSQSSLTKQQTAELQNRLQQAESAKVSFEEKCKGLVEQVTMLQQQLTLFESASKLGVFNEEENKPSTCDPEDSFSELGIKKKLIFSTPDTTISEDSGVDSQIQGLKHELQRCLTNNREKQICIDQLKESLNVYKREASSWQSECVKSEAVAQDLKKKLAIFEQRVKGSNSSKDSPAISKDGIGTLEEEFTRLKKDKEDFANNLQQAKEKEKWLESKNKELEEKLEMVLKEYSVEKADALEHCKKTYETFQDDVKERLKLDLEQKYDSKEAALHADYEEKVANLKAELEATLQREDNLKEMYVCVCQEKSQLEDKLTQDYKKKLEVEVDRLKLENEQNKIKMAQVKDVEIQCKAFENNWAETDLKDAGISTEIRERLLAEAREEVATERAQELVVLRTELTKSLEARQAQEIQHYTEKIQKDVENLNEEEDILENLVSGQAETKVLYERIKASLLTQFEMEKEEEWKLQEAELKKAHLEEIEQLQAKLGQKTAEDQAMPISPQSLKERRLDEKQRVKAAVDAAKGEWQLLHRAKVDMEVKKRLNGEKEQWQKEKALSDQKDLERILSAKQLKWQQSAEEEQKKLVAAALETAKKEWLKSREEERKTMSKTLEAERADMKKQQKEILHQLMCRLQSQYWTCIQSIKNDITKHMLDSNFRLCQLVYGASGYPAPNVYMEKSFQPAVRNGLKEQSLNLREIKSNMETKVAKNYGQDTESFVELSEGTYSCTSSELR